MTGFCFFFFLREIIVKKKMIGIRDLIIWGSIWALIEEEEEWISEKVWLLGISENNWENWGFYSREFWLWKKKKIWDFVSRDFSFGYRKRRRFGILFIGIGDVGGDQSPDWISTVHQLDLHLNLYIYLIFQFFFFFGLNSI